MTLPEHQKPLKACWQKLTRSGLGLFGMWSALLAGPAEGQEQGADRAVHDRVCARLIELYHEADYAGIHEMLTPAFQEELDLPAAEAFFGETVRNSYGRIREVAYSHREQRALVYAVKGEKAAGTLRLVVDGAGRVAGLVLRPEPPKASPSAMRPEPRHDNPLKTPLDKRVHEAAVLYYRQRQMPALSIGVLHGAERHLYQYGETAKGGGQLPTADTVYEIGSISKTFTALLLAQAVEEGKTGLSADMRPLLGGGFPQLVSGGQPVRLVHLANHTSGLPRLTDDLRSQPGYDARQPYEHHDWGMIAAYLRRVTLTAVPGTHEEYSNLGAAVLGRLLEGVLGGAYNELVEQRICRPLGLVDTAVTVRNTDLATPGYDEQGRMVPAWIMGAWAPAGGLHSTPRDMLTFLDAHLRPRDEAVKLALTQTWGRGREAAGLAWQMTVLKGGKRLIWHNGGTAGFSSFCGFVPTKEFGVVVLSNSGEAVDGLASRILRTATDQ